MILLDTEGIVKQEGEKNTYTQESKPMNQKNLTTLFFQYP